MSKRSLLCDQSGSGNQEEIVTWLVITSI